MRKIFIKDIFNILLLSHIQTTWNQLSTSHKLVPLSLQKGAAFCKLSFNATFPSCPFYRKTFLIHSLTSYLSFMHSREPQACRPEFLRNLPTYEPWLIPTCESSDSHRQQTKFAALRSALKLENRYYICNFLSSFQKGALSCNLFT